MLAAVLIMVVTSASCGNASCIVTPDANGSVVIPTNLTSIGLSDFSSCVNLISVVIADSVLYIASGAFHIQSLTWAFISDSVTSIDGAFPTCLGFGLTLLQNNDPRGGVVQCVPCFNRTSIVIPDAVTAIGELVFSGCASLTTI